ncbi:hypothetical protein DEO72_LG7g1223 [Vigna unguiculata]|uniref:Uncharacterized protein n=1 Tax=Vigna unguiculata TaxID=3917 RepID=A0A4D6MIX8_VIGUN|nr:hypothetical protein DEO72_LG7g1223 [Vigna unguiculata]
MVDTAKVELAVGAGEGGGRMTVDCCCGGSSRWLRFPLQWMAGMFEDDARCGVDGRWFAMVVSGFLGCVKVRERMAVVMASLVRCCCMRGIVVAGDEFSD